MTEKSEAHICPVCGEHMFEMYASFDVCPVCGWEDDAVQEEYPDWERCANVMSLNQARQAWKEGRRVE